MLRKMTSSQQDKFYIVFLGILVLGLFTLCMSGCANTPSGAIEHRTPIFYLDGKFHEDIPEEYIFETWGYRIQDALGNEHTYKTKVDIPHQRKETKLCTIHRQSEIIKAHYDPTGNGYYYWVRRHPKSL